MKMMCNILYGVLLLIFIPCLSCKEQLEFCSDKEVIRCDSYQIVIEETNATESLAKTFLEKCNGQTVCIFPNPDQECVKLFYSCWQIGNILEIKESTKLQQKEKFSLLSIISQGYFQGQYMDAQNITVSLSLVDESSNIAETPFQVMINEFAPFVETQNFCFDMGIASAQEVCSGSKKIWLHFGSFRSTSGWKLQIIFKGETTKPPPKVRFWIYIKGSPNDETTYLLKYNSNKGIEDTSTQTQSSKVTLVTTGAPVHVSTKSKATRAPDIATPLPGFEENHTPNQTSRVTLETTETPSTVSTNSKDSSFGLPVAKFASIFSIVAFLSVTISIICIIKCSPRSHREKKESARDIYCDVNVAPEPNMRSRGLVPAISGETLHLMNVNRGSIMTLMSQNRSLVYGRQHTFSECSDDELYGTQPVNKNEMYSSRSFTGNEMRGSRSVSMNKLCGSQSQSVTDLYASQRSVARKGSVLSNDMVLVDNDVYV